ncbi:SO_0444 family Cu/Zn efflux transporter [Alteromonas oceanisediminis]|uniref:SO_0444 family Cu/Zn efflux transporter n=1 Tax=Alteromonas oceanisediminis TaxID=2836180 RepID=UPI001BDA9381|nr:SO_0444 family Cu/Zn efflux transporter [Alteromonas oceanisediminis]MBT0586272.1 SO_0444 family Cu/Zn efflux transporter [Alteromonas oceanisediminis]
MMVFEQFLSLFIESAPYLLLGMFIAGLIHQAIPRTLIEKTLGEGRSVTTAALIGAPLPLCSCSVIPVAMGIRRSGASKASTASFLVSTPETGVDSIGITYALMGPVMAVARPVAAIFSAIVTGTAIKLWGSETPSVHQPQNSSTGCCAGATGKINTSRVKGNPKRNVLALLNDSMRYGFDKLLADFVWWLLIGLVFAALIVTYVPSHWMADYGSGPLAMVLMVAISIPMYICATASTPIAVGLILAGISPGAALVFMLTGPATNIATLMVIKKELGAKELAIYLIALIASALVSGWLFDAALSTFELNLDLHHGEHADMVNIIYQTSAVILAGLIGWQVIKTLKSYFAGSTAHVH